MTEDNNTTPPDQTKVCGDEYNYEIMSVVIPSRKRGMKQLDTE